MKILHVDSSILGEHSASRELTAATVKQLMASDPSAEVIRYDLAAQPFDHLSGAEFMAFRGREPTDPEDVQNAERNTRILDEFLAADVIVIGAPMYNFSLPSQLKAWLDRLAVVGKTFRYTATGVEGLTKGKRVIIVSSRGGFYSEGYPTAAIDYQENYLKHFIGFLGVTDVAVIRAEGLGKGPEGRSAAMDAAATEIGKLAA